MKKQLSIIILAALFCGVAYAAEKPLKAELVDVSEGRPVVRLWPLEQIGGEVNRLKHDVTRAVKTVFSEVPLSDREELFPDGIHPNAEGAGVIAKTIARTITKSVD